MKIMLSYRALGRNFPSKGTKKYHSTGSWTCGPGTKKFSFYSGTWSTKCINRSPSDQIIHEFGFTIWMICWISDAAVCPSINHTEVWLTSQECWEKKYLGGNWLPIFWSWFSSVMSSKLQFSVIILPHLATYLAAKFSLDVFAIQVDFDILFK